MTALTIAPIHRCAFRPAPNRQSTRETEFPMRALIRLSPPPSPRTTAPTARAVKPWPARYSLEVSTVDNADNVGNFSSSMHRFNCHPRRRAGRCRIAFCATRGPAGYRFCFSLSMRWRQFLRRGCLLFSTGRRCCPSYSHCRCIRETLCASRCARQLGIRQHQCEISRMYNTRPAE